MKGLKLNKPLGNEERNPFFVLWIVFLSFIVVALAVFVNFNFGKRGFQAEMQEHWPGARTNTQASVPMAISGGPVTAATAGAVGAAGPVASSSASSLETVYNNIAHMMSRVSVGISGGKVVNGSPQQVHGSGVIIAQRHVLTNYHVVENATDLHVTAYVPNKVSFAAKVIRIDPPNDLALLQMHSNMQLPVAQIGNSDQVNAGDIIFATGNAYGSGNVFTSGIVSDRSQSFTVGGRQYRSMIRTETYIYPGSSGGPLADIHGQIIGINTAIYNPNGKFTGISFVTPINRAANMLGTGRAQAINNNNRPFVPAAFQNNYSNQYSLVA